MKRFDTAEECNRFSMGIGLDTDGYTFAVCGAMVYGLNLIDHNDHGSIATIDAYRYTLDDDGLTDLLDLKREHLKHQYLIAGTREEVCARFIELQQEHLLNMLSMQPVMPFADALPI